MKINIIVKTSLISVSVIFLVFIFGTIYLSIAIFVQLEQSNTFTEHLSLATLFSAIHTMYKLSYFCMSKFNNKKFSRHDIAEILLMLA
jgi:hypothetical protein